MKHSKKLTFGLGNQMKVAISLIFWVLLLLSFLLGRQAHPDDKLVASLIDKLFVHPVEDRKEQDFKELLKLLEPRAQAGDLDAQYYLAMFYGYGLAGLKPDMQRAFSMIESLANKGYVQAESSMGHMYEHGDIHNRIDHKKAIYWYSRAAESHNRVAIDRLIRAYEKGELGLEADLEKTAYWKSKQKSNSKQESDIR